MSRLAMAGIVAFSLVTMSTAVQANCLIDLGLSEDGTTRLILTCGSSAGAGFWECPVSGGPCVGSTSPSADFLCATGLLGCGPEAKLLLRKCDSVPSIPESKPGKNTPDSRNTGSESSETR